LEDCEAEAEAEAEAAASAVAVAAISSDEIGGNVLGASPVSGSDSKNFGSADLDSISAGTDFFFFCNICWEPYISVSI
jgi:hypothetical protein